MEGTQVRVNPGVSPPVVRSRPPDPCVIVIFGVTGDLTHRKLAPALYNLAREGDLPERYAVIGTSTSVGSADGFRGQLRESVLKDARLLHPSGGLPWSRVVIEKPFGRDLPSAKELNRTVASVVEEEQTFRSDHYLGKETVQNILVFRFGNSIFEPIWNRKYIDHVQITMAEELTVERRGKFYDATGVLRDVVQNHLLQVLALCTMEGQATFKANDIHDEKFKLLRSIRPFTAQHVAEHGVAAQY